MRKRPVWRSAVSRHGVACSFSVVPEGPIGDGGGVDVIERRLHRACIESLQNPAAPKTGRSPQRTEVAVVISKNHAIKLLEADTTEAIAVRQGIVLMQERENGAAVVAHQNLTDRPLRMFMCEGG